MALVVEQRQRRVLLLLVAAPVVALVAFVPPAFLLTSGWADRLVAIGLAFEIAGVLAVLDRTTAEELELRFVWTEAERWTKPGYWAASMLLPAGFILQFVSVVFL